MKRRRMQKPSHVIAGWVEVWSTTPDQGFAVEGVVPLALPRITRQNGQIRERKPLTLPRRKAA